MGTALSVSPSRVCAIYAAGSADGATNARSTYRLTGRAAPLVTGIGSAPVAPLIARTIRNRFRTIAST